MTKINTERIDNEFAKIENEYKECKKWKEKLIDSANKYFDILKPILSKRGIKIKSTQMYYNMDCKRAFVVVEFDKKYGDYRSTKVKNLEKAIRAAKIPCPIHNFDDSVEITLYKGTLYGERF